MNALENNDTPLLSLQNVGVSYFRGANFLKKKRFWALKDVSFDIYHGETLGVIGRNGVGKSTLLRLLAGIIEPERGQIIREQCRISLLSLAVGFIGHLTGRENSILSAMLMGLRRRDIVQRLDAIQEFAGIGDFFEQPVYTYSSGMKARLGFAVALQVDPDVMLIDEVLGVGDTEFKEKSSAELKKRIRADKTVILVSHNVATIRDLCDRAVWIEKGKTRMIGDVDRVIEAYLDNRSQTID